ncbi:MAG: hypothetical protein AB7F35_09440 [Acetobacteraceae bacterium]
MSMLCGCCACLHVFPAMEVIDWIDDGETPLCPTCGMDTVLPGITDPGELWELHRRRFGSAPPLVPLDGRD